MWLTFISLGIGNTVISAQTRLQIHFHVNVSISIESRLRLNIVLIVPSQPYRPPGSKSFMQIHPIGPSGLLGP